GQLGEALGVDAPVVGEDDDDGVAVRDVPEGGAEAGGRRRAPTPWCGSPADYFHAEPVVVVPWVMWAFGEHLPQPLRGEQPRNRSTPKTARSAAVDTIAPAGPSAVSSEGHGRPVSMFSSSPSLSVSK